MSTSQRSRPVEVLLVEDAAGDIELTLEALEDTGVPNRVSVVSNGEAALSHLERTRAAGEARPDLILLDLNLPRMDGSEVLENLKSDPEFRRIPVIVLTSSKAEEGIVRAYDLHANSYVTKPVGGEEFMATIHAIGAYWLETVRLPPR